MARPRLKVSSPSFPDDEAAASFLFNSLQRTMSSDGWHGPDAETRDLTPTRELLERMGSPGVSEGYILVTGSKGKGSTSVIAAKILEALGYRVGLLTSPSLVNFRERVRINGRAIPPEEWIALVERIAPHVEEIDSALPPNRYFSPTGMILAIAQLYFAAHDVQIGVIEAGRGGRFDDTRLVPNAVSALTPIMYEHTDELGPTLSDIAWHKAGIIKPNSVVVSAAQQPEALEVVEREASLQGARLRLLGREFEAALTRGGDLDNIGLAMTLRTPRRDYGELWLPLLGHYQVENTAVAMSAVEALLEQLNAQPEGNTLERAVREGLSRVRWPGRCQVLRKSPLVLLDGAINDESAALFRESVGHLVRQPVVALVAVPSTKDYEGVLRQMGEIASAVVLTRFDTPYLTFPEDAVILETARQHFETALARPTFDQAYEAARQLAGEDGTILIVGTQTLSKVALRYWDYDLEVV